MKKNGIIDHFEGDYIYVEIDEDTVKIPREGAPAMLAEGTVVIVEDGRIVGVDEIETQRMEDDMRRRFERTLCGGVFLRQYRIIGQERFASKFCALIRRGFAAILTYCKKSQRNQGTQFPQSAAALIVRCCLKFPKKARRYTWKRNLF